MTRVLLVEQPSPSVAETVANNIGMRAARGKYWVLVQVCWELWRQTSQHGAVMRAQAALAHCLLESTPAG